MKVEDMEKLIGECITEDTTVNRPDTDGLLLVLDPVMEKKCADIREVRRRTFEAAVFILCGIAAFVTGIMLLFPDFVDFSDEAVQFASIAFAGGFILSVIYLLAKELLKRVTVHEGRRLRGRLL